MKFTALILPILVLAILSTSCTNKLSAGAYDKPGPENCDIMQDQGAKQKCAMTNLIRAYDSEGKFDYSDGTFELVSPVQFTLKDGNNDEVVDNAEFEFEIESKKAGSYNVGLTLSPTDPRYKSASYEKKANLKKGKNKLKFSGDSSQLGSLEYTTSIVVAEEYSQKLNRINTHFINLTLFKFPNDQYNPYWNVTEVTFGETREPEPKAKKERKLPDLLFDKAQLTINESGIKADLVVKNVGEGGAFAIFVEAYIDGEPYYGKTNQNQKTILKPGETWSLTLILPNTDEVTIVVDDLQANEESDEANNIYVERFE